MNNSKKRQSKVLLSRVLLKNIFRSSAFLLIFFLCFVPIKSTQSSPVLSAKNTATVSKQKIVKEVNPNLPVRLTIPKIKVNTVVESVGLTPKGAVDVPKGPVNAAWFNLGAYPGDNGNAVMTGHFGYWKNGRRGVFNNLTKLKKGDKIYVKDKQGTTITFVVRDFKTYGQNDDAPEVFVSTDGQAHLNLITCFGTWNKVTKSYPKRLVVFADKE